MYKRSNHVFEEDFVRIPLTKGKESLVDYQDYLDISSTLWHASKPHNVWYARRTCMRKTGKSQTISMHRQILGLHENDNLDVDHKNGDGLDNRRENLRICTHSQNCANSSGRGGTSSYKGVWFNPKSGRWQTVIKVRGKGKWLGSYENEEDAARAYDRAALKYFGEFAKLNFE